MQQPVANPLDAMIFAERAPAIVLTLICMHGDNDAYSRAAISFPRTQEGHAAAGRLVLLVEQLLTDTRDNQFHWYSSIEHMLEDYVEECAEKLDLDEGFVKEHLTKLLTHDSTYQDYTAKPMAYFIERFDPDGGVSRAMFPDHYNPGQLVGIRCYDGLLPSFYPEEAWPTE